MLIFLRAPVNKTIEIKFGKVIIPSAASPNAQIASNSAIPPTNTKKKHQQRSYYKNIKESLIISYSKGFRAPSISELYLQHTTTYGLIVSGNSPYDFRLRDSSSLYFNITSAFSS